jgi:5-methylcytosine-specific restriction endonuclease McrA
MTRFCPKCKAETDHHNSGRCKPCAKYYAAKWYQANRERSIEAAKSWQKANPERTKSTTAAYYAANSERKKAYSKAWGEANPERKKEKLTAWREANPEARRIHEHNRRARKRENGGNLSKGLTKKLFKLQNGKCPCCQQPLGNDFNLDHIVPLALGGSNTDENIQLLRKQCNNQKSAKHPIDFMQSKGFLL